MKTAIYIEDGMTQIVITPETDFDKAALKALRDKQMTDARGSVNIKCGINRYGA